jgi:hypothetical protein
LYEPVRQFGVIKKDSGLTDRRDKSYEERRSLQFDCFQFRRKKERLSLVCMYFPFFNFFLESLFLFFESASSDMIPDNF